MQMVMCEKCEKPISHVHKFEIVSVVDKLPYRRFVRHIQCDDPFGINFQTNEKTMPMFTWEGKNRNKTV